MTLPSGSVYFTNIAGNSIYYVPGIDNDFLFYSENNTSGDVVFLGDFTVNPDNITGTIASAQNTTSILGGNSTTAIFQIVNVTFAQVGLNLEPFYDTKIYGTDGTPSGTQLLADFQGYSEVSVYTTQNGLTYFAPGNVAEVYSTDGTAAGTQLLFDAGTGSAVSVFGTNGNSVLFQTQDSPTLSIYTTNGTTAGTAIIASIGVPSNVAPTDATSSTAGLMGTDGSRTIFDLMTTTLIPAGLGYTTDYVIDIYGTDGTSAGTQLLCQFSAAPQALLGATGVDVYTTQNGITYFADVNNPTQVYATNGTAAGTAEIFNAAAGSAISFFGSAGNSTLFTALNGATLSVYVSNGLVAGTALIASIGMPSNVAPTDAATSIAIPMGTDGSRTLFGLMTTTLIPAGLSYTTNYVIDVYGTDGTFAGTQLLCQFSAAPQALLGVTGVDVYTTQNGITYFADVNNPAQVYATNGTTAGTYQIFDAGAGTVNYISTVAGQSYFTVTSAAGVAVYVTNLGSTSAALVGSAGPGSTVSATYDGIKTLVTIENADQIVQRFWINPNDSSITGAGDEFTWVGPVSGDWDVAGNWEDTTAGTNPAAMPPGAKDSVTFNGSTSFYQVIGGAGDAAYLTFNGDNIVTGQLTPAVLTVGGTQNNSFSILDIDSGATVSANTVDIAYGSTISVSGSGAVLTASSGIVIGENQNPTDSGLLSAADGADIQTASLSLIGYYGWLSVDSASSIEVGTLGGAAIGALTIDPGATLSEAAAFSGNTIEGSVIDNGQIVVSSGDVDFIGGSLSGTGTIDIQNGGTVSLAENVSGSLSFDLAPDASLSITQAGTADTINLTGANDILTIEPTGFGEPPTFGMAAAISGFTATDALLVDGAVTAATYVAGTVAGTGSLVLTDGSDPVATLTLDGDYTGNTFLTIPLSSDETEIALSTTVTADGSIDVPSGGTISNSLIYANGFEKIETGGVDNTPTIAGGTLELVAGGTIGGDISFSGTNSTLIIDPQGTTTTIPPNTITGFSPGDTIQLSGVSFVGSSSTFGAPNADSYTVANAGTLTIDADGTDYNISIAGVTIGQDNFVLNNDLQITEVAAGSGTVPCFVIGTRLSTARGEVAVEDLRVGDTVRTAIRSSVQTIVWIGNRHVDCTRHPEPQNVWPVRVSAHAFGQDRPCRDLWLSPDHAIYVDGSLIPVKYLINGTTVSQIRMAEVSYYHVELEYHDVVLSEGLPTESYLDTGDRENFINGGPATPLHPDFSKALYPEWPYLTWEAKGCAPLAVTGDAVVSARRLLETRATALEAPPEEDKTPHRRSHQLSR